MIDYEKPLPLIPNSNQINTIKPLNHRKREERDVEIQASISPSLFKQNLDFKRSVDAEMGIGEDGIERFEKGGV